MEDELDYSEESPPPKRQRTSSPPSRPFIPLCQHSTRALCPVPACPKVHFIKALRPHTLESLGDCSYLNTCHRMEGCRYVHWALEDPGKGDGRSAVREKVQGPDGTSMVRNTVEGPDVLPPQWIDLDLRSTDLSVLGKFEVIIADPPWAIHQELPYGTLTDDEMMRMPVGSMQDEGGLLFLWVTGRAMELGRECLAAWGYERIDELVWIKTNQLQGLIRTGRTGHWLNHSKEHCLVAIRRTTPVPLPLPYPSFDTQVILSEVRETSRKPDELYAMIERLLVHHPHARKCELFGRTHNLRSGWMTIGNQFAGGRERVFEESVVRAFGERYSERGMVLAELPRAA